MYPAVRLARLGSMSGTSSYLSVVKRASRRFRSEKCWFGSVARAVGSMQDAHCSRGSLVLLPVQDSARPLSDRPKADLVASATTSAHPQGPVRYPARGDEVLFRPVRLRAGCYPRQRMEPAAVLAGREDR